MRVLSIIAISAVIATACSSEEEKTEEKEGPDQPVQEQTQMTPEDVLGELQELASNQQISKEIVDKMIDKTMLFHRSFPEDERTAEVLFMTAANAQMIGERGRDSGNPQTGYFHKCISLLDIIIADYPEFADMKSVHSLKAVILDLDLEQKDEAVKAYQYLIDTYPEDTFNIENNWKVRIENIDENPLDAILAS